MLRLVIWTGYLVLAMLMTSGAAWLANVSGWSAYTARASCRNLLILVPENFAPLLWGWPNRFVERMLVAEHWRLSTKTR
jgi:hypothetical protein